jgi:hypothetical protein
MARPLWGGKLISLSHNPFFSAHPFRCAAFFARHGAAEKKSAAEKQRRFWLTEAYRLNAWAVATAQATVAPTMGLLPMPIKPIIST